MTIGTLVSCAPAAPGKGTDASRHAADPIQPPQQAATSSPATRAAEQSAGPSWQRFDSATHRFGVEVPEPLTERRQDIPAPGGGAFPTFIFTGQGDYNLNITVGYDPAGPLDAKSTIGPGVDVQLRLYRGKVLESRWTTFQGRTTYDVVIGGWMRNTQVRVFLRYMIDGNRLVLLNTVFPSESADQKLVLHFWNSFRFTA